ncbi:sucrose-6-phosphate hydrolase [Oribacterium sp. oral taxon 078 str. F0262]|uniref:glycoside hydrolase family 32 protein n=1 Tax=Oribacterium sp. oral taxon 078 TaxID=652706 RepID=UPI0001BCC255|nr:GH32 C-terminal domain-containing protein [Oribacterium sp. oral taxon 078]EFE91715.1 sucrose-6-phosphate hydrolase [Oribacterium sp. oral taxon 078 str. F0262]
MSYLEEAREYEERMERKIAAEERPLYHLTARTGWLNDPNGFSFYGGRYHLFYQYNPYSTHWDRMHWGEWSSPDLIHWSFERAAMAPDEAYESGCFSGSAALDREGNPVFMYTAHRIIPDGREEIVRETQCIARLIERELVKEEGNPVISEEGLPEGFSLSDFRDPKIWREGEYFYSVLSSRFEDGLGAVLLYRSSDLLHWDFVKLLKKNDGRFGRMWECPDFFRLDDHSVLFVSAIAMKALSPEFRNGFCSLAFLGKDLGGEPDLREKRVQALDLGFDFYAPQTMLSPDGRRILIAWMQAPESGNLAPEGAGWYGQMCFPRELSIRGGRLFQSPIREISSLYGESTELDLCADSERSIPELHGRTMDLSLELKAEREDFCELRLCFAKRGNIFTTLSYRPAEGRLILDRRAAGRAASICEYREVLLPKREKEASLRLLLDRFSFEIFLNGGESVLSGTLYDCPAEAGELTIFAKGARIRAVKHEIESGILRGNC